MLQVKETFAFFSALCYNDVYKNKEGDFVFCKKCGHKLVDGARFCTDCGTVITDDVRSVYDKNIQSGTVNPTDNETSENKAEEIRVSAPVKPVCKVCGQPCTEGLRFCTGCGTALDEDLHNEGVINIAQTTAVTSEVSNFDVTVPQQKKKSKAPLVIILVVIALLLVGGIVAFLLLDPFGLKSDETEATSISTTADNGSGGQNGDDVSEITQATEEITEPVESAPVTDLTGKLDRGQMQSLLGNIAEKENRTGVVIKVALKADLKEDAESFAKKECVKECGENGIFVVFDAKSKTAALATSGNGEKYVGGVAKKMVKSGVSDYLKDEKYYEAITDVVNSILDTEKVNRFKKVDGAEQVVFVEKSSDSNTGKLTLVEWYEGEEIIVYEISKVYLGKDGITASPSETKSATPKGTFRLGFAFSDKKLNTKLDSVVIKSGDVWVDDSDSKYYNTLQHGSTSNSKWDSAENTYYAFSSGIFEACILIEHNGDGYTKGESGKGSCIYLSGKNKELSTSYGDVNISASQMEDLLSCLDESKNPHIVIA